MAHVRGAAPEDPELDRLVDEVFANQARNYFDLFHFAGRPPEDVARVTDFAAMAAIARDFGHQGAVAVTFHYGNLDIVAQSIMMAGLRALAAVERLQPRQRFELVCRIRSRTGLELVPVDRAPLGMLHALRDGKIVVLAADRDVAEGGMRMPFFGAPALVPDGYARLVRLADAPILIARSRRLPDGRFELEAMRVAVPAPTGNRDDDVRSVVTAVLAAFETILAEDPTQWVLFRELWPDHAAPAKAPHSSADRSGEPP